MKLKWMICECGEVDFFLQHFLGWHKQSLLCESVKYALWFFYGVSRGPPEHLRWTQQWVFSQLNFTFLWNCECMIVCTTCLNNFVLAVAAAAEHLLSFQMLWQRTPASSNGLERVNVHFVEKRNTYSLCAQQIRHVTVNVVCCNTTANEGTPLEVSS